jgi:hypothetical protein
MTTENDLLKNPLKEEVAATEELVETQEKEAPPKHLRNFMIQYTGQRLMPEDDKITLEMLVEVLADEFPEVVMALAEENFMRGYQQALQDVEVMQKMPDSIEQPEQGSSEVSGQTIIDAEFTDVEKK